MLIRPLSRVFIVGMMTATKAKMGRVSLAKRRLTTLDNARRDLGLGGDEEEEADEEEADEEEADEEEAAEGANADCLARMGAGAAGAGAGAARAAGVAREMAVAARAPRGSGPNRSPCQHQAMDGQGRRAHQWDCVGLQQVQGQSL